MFQFVSIEYAYSLNQELAYWKQMKESDRSEEKVRERKRRRESSKQA